MTDRLDKTDIFANLADTAGPLIAKPLKGGWVGTVDKAARRTMYHVPPAITWRHPDNDAYMVAQFLASENGIIVNFWFGWGDVSVTKSVDLYADFVDAAAFYDLCETVLFMMISNGCMPDVEGV